MGVLPNLLCVKLDGSVVGRLVTFVPHSERVRRVRLIVGLGSLWLYSEVNAYEASGGTLNWKLDFLYGIIGKWGVVGLPACIALIKLCTGFAKLSRSR